MADLESEISDMKEKNTELVQEVQYWKMIAAQRENEKLDLIKENNDLRLKLSRLRSGGAAHARKLDAALQSASEEALSALVQASGAIARTLELAKTYMQDREELDTVLPRWSTLSSTPSSEKINKVPPMLIGGRLIQPVVSLSRMLQSNYSGPVRRRPNETNHGVSERVPLPLHMLQDVYIPLTRIDASEVPINNVDNHTDTNEADDSTEDLALDDSTERITEEPQNVRESEDFEESRSLDPVSEEVETEDNLTRERSSTENPLEGPSWLLDRPRPKRKVKSSTNFEPDSTTEFENSRLNDEPGPSTSNRIEYTPSPSLTVGIDVSKCEFSPTVRRRQRASPPITPHCSPSPSRRHGNNDRILKVLVTKMRLNEDLNDGSPPKRSKVDTPKSQKLNPHLSEARRQSAEGSTIFQVREVSPSKILMRFDAPSPNGSTDSRVIVLESKHNQPEPGCSGVSKPKPRTLKKMNSTDSRSDRNKSQNTNQNDRENSHLNDSQNGRQNDIQNRQHSDGQCNSDTRHQSDNTMSNNHTNITHNHQRGIRIEHESDSQNDDSQNSHLNDSQNGRQNDIQNRQHSDSQCNSDTRHQSDNNMSNNHTNITHNHQRGIRIEHESDSQNDDRKNSHLNDTQNDIQNRQHSDGQCNSDIKHQSDYNMTNNHTNITLKHHRGIRIKHESDNDNININECNSHDSDSSSSELLSKGRTRRPRKPIVYKEKPLNRKLRR